MNYCGHCGTRVAPESEFCGACGAPLVDAERPVGQEAAPVTPLTARRPRRRWGRYVIGAVAGLFALLVVLAIVGSLLPPTPQPRTSIAAAPVVTHPLATALATPRPTAGPSIHDIITSQIDASRITREVVAPASAPPHGTEVLVYFEERDAGIHDLTASLIKMDVFNTMKALYTSHQPIARVTLVPQQVYKDTEGHAALCDVAGVILDKEEAVRIAWDNISQDDLWADMQIIKDIKFCA